MDCRRVRFAMFLVSDNELEPELVIAFRSHLTVCPECARRFEFLSHLLALVRRRCLRHQAPLSLRTRILASLPHRRGSVDLV